MTMKESDIFFRNHLAQTTMFPFALEIERAEGIYLFDKKGKRYFDMISGIGVSNLGHGNRHIAEAIKSQADQHLHVMVYGEYLQSAQQNAATMLASLLPSSLDCCYFVNSGTEANEAALKLAKRVTGRTRIISCRGAYHGSTHGSLSVSGNETKKSTFRPLLPDIYFIRFNEVEDIDWIDENTACVIMETIQGDAGVRIPDKAYLKAVRKRCDETGALLIFDEIQCGIGRSGTMFAFEQFDVVPDILTLGKALGGGLPVGCMISSTEKMKQFTHDPMLGHISTFAGHPVICAAVAANFEVLQNENIVKDVFEKGNKIARILGAHPAVKHIRHRGLFFAIDMENAEVVQQVVERNLENGLISFWFLSCPWSFRIAPPLIISDKEIEEATAIILSAFDSVG
ncbi:MAG: aspartate aminotransferase family protein [Crocinitomicaceae bacterium]|nr:aspartate aminotransferase family protein [Crocinitomicaceae bacterium]